jgi:phenylalanine-4-hydroxylase
MDLKEVRWEGMDFIEPAYDRDRWRTLCECGNEISGSLKCGEFLNYLTTCQPLLHRIS